jgi:glutamate racemase
MIGVIDSGLGGLAIARAIWSRLPDQAMIFLADHEFFPYGNKPPAVINRRLTKIMNWLVNRNCRLVVIACNTITAVAVDRLRRQYKIPFVGTEPMVKGGGVVLATPTTASSRRYQQLSQNYPVKTLACPGLAEAIEAGREIQPLLPLLPSQTNRLILGCTHYLLVKEAIQKCYGRKLEIVDPSAAIAEQTVKLLKVKIRGKREFFTTGNEQAVSRRAGAIFSRRIIFTQCRL